MAVTRTDDLDGTAGATPVSFSLDGHAFEIDLSPENAQAFKGMFRPYLAKSRSVGFVVCLPRDHIGQVLALEAETLGQSAVATGNGSASYPEADRSARPILQLATPAPAVPHQPDHTPQPVTPPPTQAPTAQTTVVKDPEVREWAKRWSVPNVPTRGRVPAHIREAHDAFHNGDKGPWKALLKKAGVDPSKAEAQARRLTAVDSAKQAEPTPEEFDRAAAKRVGTLSSAQLTRLRRMINAPDGRAIADRKNGDTTSFEALAHRGCCILISSDTHTRTYEITNAGRLWFDVRGISPVND
ncbi:Lsr2 dimerization domain-containing protein [Streptomyces sp. Midd1]|uniref:Lsr2 dimerization domain-containing protein n=1 Tax=Streptomyces sp. Midd3 TaxID=3161191 RepID=UPI0034DABBFF